MNYVCHSFAEFSLMMGNRLPLARVAWRALPLLEKLDADEVAQIFEISQARSLPSFRPPSLYVPLHQTRLLSLPLTTGAFCLLPRHSWLDTDQVMAQHQSVTAGYWICGADLYYSDETLIIRCVCVCACARVCACTRVRVSQRGCV